MEYDGNLEDQNCQSFPNKNILALKIPYQVTDSFVLIRDS